MKKLIWGGITSSENSIKYVNALFSVQLKHINIIGLIMYD